MILISGRLAGAILLFLAITISWTCAQNPKLPTIPAGNFNVTTFGAVGDGVTTNTTAIQNAINAASAAGGGTVEIPANANAYLSGPLTLASDINLQVDSGAILRMLPYLVYPNTSPLITASSLTNLEITGTGTIDGQANFASWWTNNPSLSTSQRPILVSFNSCKIVLIQDITLENPPSMHIVFKGSDGNITIQGITINSPGNSPNTDGIDLIGTNVVVKGCSISAGDDCIALGSTGGTSYNTMVTNCAFGTGHGMSVGSNTSGGVSNLVVVNCTFNGTEYGLRLKSDTNSTSGGEGGITQNLFYENLIMSNITEAPIVIYSYYNENGTPTSVKPSTAAGEPVIPVLTTTCSWHNIAFSNITSTVGFPAIAGILWGRTELPMTNIMFYNVNIASLGPFDIYNAHNVQFINSQVTPLFGGQKFLLFNGGVTFSNTLPASETTNESMGAYVTNSTFPFALYNASASTTNPDMFAASPMTISGGTLTISNNFTMPNSDVFNFALGTNTSTVAVGGNLTFNNTTINVTNAACFGAGTYTLFSYTGSEAGTYALGITPTNNFNYALTNTSGQIQFLVSTTGPSLTPVTVLYTNSGGQLQLSWPQDHTGWFVQIQTNNLSTGLSTNWTTIPASNSTNVFSLPVNPTNGSVFLRLFFP